MFDKLWYTNIDLLLNKWWSSVLSHGADTMVAIGPSNVVLISKRTFLFLVFSNKTISLLERVLFFIPPEATAWSPATSITQRLALVRSRDPIVLESLSTRTVTNPRSPQRNGFPPALWIGSGPSSAFVANLWQGCQKSLLWRGIQMQYCHLFY